MSRKFTLFALLVALACALLIGLGVHQNAKNALRPTGASPSNSELDRVDATGPITATLAVCGDTMSHTPQTNDAYDKATDTYSYHHCFQFIQSWIEKADYAVANLETTLNGPPYTGYPQFCAPDALAHNMKEAGFDLVTTANNHSLDKGFSGICRTLDVLDEAGLAHVGSYRSQEEFDKNKGVTVADVGGIKVAFLGYTYGTNGIPIAEENDFCLNRFNTDYNSTCSTLDEAKLKAELDYAKTLQPDLIAVMIHWGIEYQTTQNEYQNQVADFLIKNGADLILGSHSHVPQPMMTRTVTLEDGSTREGFVCFSLGNFMSNQSPATVKVDYTDTTAILNLELTKDFETGKTTVSQASYVPLLVLNRGTSAADQYVIMDVHASIDAYESGDPLVTQQVYQQLQYALTGCHTIFGEDFDYTKVSSTPQDSQEDQAEVA